MDKLLLRPTEAATVLSIGRSKVYEADAVGAAPVGEDWGCTSDSAISARRVR